MPKPFSFVVLSKEAWSNARRARKQLLFEAMLRQPGVSELLYVDPPAQFGKSPIREVSDSPMIRVCERAWVLKGERFSFIRWINRLMVYLTIKKYLNPEVRWFTFLYNPWDIYLARFLSHHGPVIFDWTEDWGDYYNDNFLGTKQIDAVNASSAVVAVTEDLAARAEKISKGNKNILFLPNATDWKPAENLKSPEDLEHIPYPRLGYSGSLGPWFDKELVMGLANARPDWHWVIVGEANDHIKDILLKAKNIHVLGQRPFHKLQSYMCQCQVLVAPYINNIKGDATKLYDYLTLDIPIVSTKNRTAERLQPFVKIAVDKASWLNLLEKTLNEHDNSTAEAQQQASLFHTWDIRASKLLDWLEKI